MTSNEGVGNFPYQDNSRAEDHFGESEFVWNQKQDYKERAMNTSFFGDK